MVLRSPACVMVIITMIFHGPILQNYTRAEFHQRVRIVGDSSFTIKAGSETSCFDCHFANFLTPYRLVNSSRFESEYSVLRPACTNEIIPWSRYDCSVLLEIFSIKHTSADECKTFFSFGASVSFWIFSAIKLTFRTSSLNSAGSMITSSVFITVRRLTKDRMSLKRNA